MTLQITNDPLVAQWMVERMPEDNASLERLGSYTVFGIYDSDTKKAVCGWLFGGFREMPHGNEMSVVVFADNPRWCLPGILRKLFGYAFETAGCERLTAVIREGNKRSIRVAQGLGFRKEGVIRRGYNGKTNAIVFGMLKSECRWLKRKEA